jgi:anti-sigma factor ChrR (cupin superfamily)
MTSVMCRYTEEDVLAFVAGDLSDAELMAMAVHFGECDDCREQAAEFTALQRTIERCTEADVVRWDAFETPFGSTYAAVTGTGLARVSWREPEPAGHPRSPRRRRDGASARRVLRRPADPLRPARRPHSR